MKISLTILTYLALIGFANVVNGVKLQGKLTDIPETFLLVDHNQYVNGDNLASRCDIKLTSLDNNHHSSSRILLNRNYEFSSRSLDLGKYDLTITCHDFSFNQDRFIIDVNDTTILASEYRLDKTELGQPKDITNEPLAIKTMSTRQYYEIRQNSLANMISNSPLGFIFKNKIYTAMFIFCAVMMVGPYLLRFFNPEMAKRMEELQREQAKQGTIFVDPNEKSHDSKNPSKIEEISRANPSSARKRR